MLEPGAWTPYSLLYFTVIIILH